MMEQEPTFLCLETDAREAMTVAEVAMKGEEEGRDELDEVDYEFDYQL